MQAIRSYFKLLYNGKNITEDISKHLIELSYTDKITGESDDLEIRLDDKDGFWQDAWYPDKGATLSLEFGYNNGQILKPNIFELDEIVTSFGLDGDIVTIKGIGAAFIKSDVKTKRSHAHENKTLLEIVNGIAAKYGFKVVGDIADIRIGRVTQKREKDFTFLSRLASEYGYNFNVRNKRLIFTHIKSLESVPRALTIDKTDITGGSITDKSTLIYKSATVKSHNPNTNSTVDSTSSWTDASNKDKTDLSFISQGPALEVRTKTENQQQAITKAEAALHHFNGLQQTANISVPGNILALAGNNIELTGFGRNSGIWSILSSKHTISIDGYSTDIELKKIIPSTVSGSKKKPKTVVVKTPTYKVSPQRNKDDYQYSIITQN